MYLLSFFNIPRLNPWSNILGFCCFLWVMYSFLEIEFCIYFFKSMKKISLSFKFRQFNFKCTFPQTSLQSLVEEKFKMSNLSNLSKPCDILARCNRDPPDLVICWWFYFISVWRPNDNSWQCKEFKDRILSSWRRKCANPSQGCSYSFSFTLILLFYLRIIF